MNEKTRKTLYDISWQVTEEEYRADSAYSYSTISKFNRDGFDNLKSLYDRVDSSSLLFGSMVDTLLTDGQEEFDRRFLVAEFPKLSDNINNIIRKIQESVGNDYKYFEEIPDEIVSGIAKECDFWGGDKWDKVRAKKVKENDCSALYDILQLSQNKTVVSTDMFKDANDCADILKTDATTRFYFETNNPFDARFERFYQLKFKGDYKGIPLRMMAD